MSYRFQKRKPSRVSRFSKIAPILATGFGFIAFAMIVPSGTSSKSEARIFTQGISIQIDRSSPAYAALEDTLQVADTQAADEFSEVATEPSRALVSGMSFIEPAAVRIVREIRREESLAAQERVQRLANSQALVAALSNAMPTVQAAQPTQQSSPVAVSNVVVNVPAKKISAKEMAEFFKNFAQDMSSKKPAFTSTGRSRLPSSVPSTAMVSKTDIAGLASGRSKQESQAEAANPNPDVHQLVIAGPVEFTGGIAITNSSDQLVVYQEVDEEVLGHARVDLRDGKYEIFVDQPIGRLVGELRTSGGELLGRGYFNLSTLPRLETNQYRVEKIAVMIGPIPHGIIGSVTTAPVASDANPKARVLPVKSAHVQLGQLPFDTVTKKDGTFKDDNLAEGSLVITHADRPGHWGALGFSVAGWPTELPMFTDATVRAIMVAATNSDHEDERHTAIVWGRVTRSGVPLKGAKVDMMTSEAQAVYFNQDLLPDPTLKTTSENGLYAFFPLEPGSHAVQAGEGTSVTEPSVFPTDAQTTTQVNLELNVTRSAKIRVYDAFKTDWPLSAEVISMGRKHGALVPKNGEKKVTFTGGNGVLILDTDAGSSYELVRTTVVKSQTKIDVPMVQSVWVNQIKGALRVNSDLHTGVIVGFIRGMAAYQASLENESLGPSTKIVYFNERGELTGQSFGQAGGGFMILNVPQGFRTVLIQPSGSSAKALATAVLVESRVTNVISKTF